MDYISQSPIHCLKVLIKYIINCNNFPKKGNVYMFKTNCSSLEHQYKNLILFLTNKRGRNISHSQFMTTNYYPHQNN